MMQKAAVVLVTIFSIMVFSNVAFGADDDYFTLFIGASSPTDSQINDSTITGEAEVSYDLGYMFGIAAGHDFGKYRFEGEISYQKNDTDEGEYKASYNGFWYSGSGDVEGDITLWNLLGNFYWDIMESGPITPYLTVGFGLTSVQVKGSDVDEQDAVTSIHGGAGILYALNTSTSLDIRYRYQITSDLEFDTTDVDFSTHCLIVGIKMNF